MLRRNIPSLLMVYLIYLAAIAMTVALLVFWVVVVQSFTVEINEMISRLGVQWNHFHWFVHSTGAALFFLVIVALTYLLAVTLSERRYSDKREEFLASVTHDLKSPVAAIKLHAQTLEQDDLSAEERAQFTGYIVNEAERVTGLVDNLLESSRLLASSPPRQPREIHLGDFFREYQNLVHGRFDLSHVDLDFEIRTRAVVTTTNEALQRVMDNLIDNALRFTGAGGRILCQVSDRLGVSEIVVADNGAGIPKRELGRIFDRFYQVRQEVGQTRRGTGLGLAIVRALVEEMRGTVRAISGGERPGTRFEIELPRVESAAMPASEKAGGTGA